MDIGSHRASNGKIEIHYLVSNEQDSSVPLLICPGLSETAEEYVELMTYLSPRKCVALSFRGRGQSDTPESGYDLEHHVSDIAAVVADAQLNRFHLYANSRGVAYALGYLEKHPAAVLSVLLQEYPAEHRALPEGWAEDYLLTYLVQFSRQRNIRPEAVRGIERESTQRRLSKGINKKLLVLRGMLADSLLDEEDCRRYERLCPDAAFAVFGRSGHDLRQTEKELLYRTIGDFIL
ncbi:alpha/beta fold hydrolase [Cohnella cellulosilytica]|uniref:Alpha/beta fold hydrolase n=1 Tax=Cohnella cellulosilytica TaxID=986710 RepID=A0ABW2FNA1_9BACL